MAGITPISGGMQVGLRGTQGLKPLGTPNTAAADKAKKPGEGNFLDVLKAYVDNVDQKQKSSADAIQDLVTGKTHDVLPVVNQVAKADLSFKMLMGVRNKMIEAYKETMRMQI